MKYMKIEKIVPDTSAVIESLVSKKLESKDISVKTILIHEAVLTELENQANHNKEVGYLGLAEIKNLENSLKNSNSR